MILYTTIYCLYLFLLDQNLRKMEGETQEPVRDLDELQNSDWVKRLSSYCTSRFTSVTMSSYFHYLIVCVLAASNCLNKAIYSFSVCARPGSGCRWCETSEMVWSWRRSRSVSTTRCPSSTSWRRTKCWWMTSAPNATSCEKSWYKKLNRPL